MKVCKLICPADSAVLFGYAGSDECVIRCVPELKGINTADVLYDLVVIHFLGERIVTIDRSLIESDLKEIVVWVGFIQLV